MELTVSNWFWNAGGGGVRKLAAFVLLAWMLCVAWSSRASAEVGTTTVQGLFIWRMGVQVRDGACELAGLYHGKRTSGCC
jgi:hypothetical protein